MKKITCLTALLLILVSCNTNTQKAKTEVEPEPVASKTVDTDYDPEAKLSELNIQLPPSPTPIANFVGAVRTGNLVFLSGQGPLKGDGTVITGVVGKDLDIDQGYEAARVVGINLLAALKAEVGNLNKVKRIVKVMGMVNAVTDFAAHPKVINGHSDLMVEVFGERGKHARAAVGMGSLPGNIAVEIEMIVEVEE